MKKIIILIGIIIIARAAWYLASPLFITTEINENFPELEAVLDTPDTIMTEAMPLQNQASQIKSGLFKNFDNFHQGSGKATIYKLSNNKNLLRFENFKVTNGPDLQVLLVKNTDPKNRNDLGDDYLNLGSLKGNVGNQNYELPENINLADYGSIVIYCQPFHVIFSTASLSSL
jgi:hypothetical protein